MQARLEPTRVYPLSKIHSNDRLKALPANVRLVGNCNKFYFTFEFELQIWARKYQRFKKDRIPIHYLLNNSVPNTDQPNILKLAYYNRATITAVKSFIVQAPGWKIDRQVKSILGDAIKIIKRSIESHHRDHLKGGRERLLRYLQTKT